MIITRIMYEIKWNWNKNRIKKNREENELNIAHETIVYYMLYQKVCVKAIRLAKSVRQWKLLSREEKNQNKMFTWLMVQRREALQVAKFIFNKRAKQKNEK